MSNLIDAAIADNIVDQVVEAAGVSDEASTADNESKESEVKEESNPKTSEQTVQEEVDGEAKSEEKDIVIKVNGRDVPVKDMHSLRVLAQKGLAADEKFSEAAKIREESLKLFEKLKQNPVELFQKAGVDPYNFAQDLILQKMNQEQMSDEQRRVFELEQKVQQLTDQLTTKDKEKTEAEMKQMAEQYKIEYAKKINDALVGAELPTSQPFIQRVARYLYDGIEKGAQISPEDAVRFVKEDIQEEYKVFKEKEPEKKPESPKTEPDDGDEPKKRRREKKKVEWSTFKEYLDNLDD